MEFVLNGKKYNPKPYNIGLKNKLLYYINELNKITTKYTYNIDYKYVKNYETEIENLRYQLNQSEEYLTKLQESEEKDENEIAEYKEIVEKQTGRLHKKQREYESDEHAGLISKIYSDSILFAIEEFITNENLIKGFLNGMFEEEIRDYNIEEDEARTFAIQAVSFFLQNQKMNNEKSKY